MVKIMENPIKMGDLGGKPTIFGNIHMQLRIFYKILLSILLMVQKSGDHQLREVGSLSHLQGLYIPCGWEWDFWSINFK